MAGLSRRYFSVGSMAKVDALEGGENTKELLAQREQVDPWDGLGHLSQGLRLIHHPALSASSRIRATSSGASNAVKCPLLGSTM